jgi:hypothetical protein
MANKDFSAIDMDFFGHNDTFGNASEGSLAPLTISDTSPAGGASYGYVASSATGELAIDMAADVEIENLTLFQDDILQFDIDDLIDVSWKVKMNQATPDSTSMFSIGVIGTRNATIDSIAQSALFRLVGASAALTVETDDGTNQTSLVTTNRTLAAAYKTLTMSFVTGKADIRFFIDGNPVATDTTFSMAAYSGKLQVFAQIQKTADSNEDGFTVDRLIVNSRS